MILELTIEEVLALQAAVRYCRSTADSRSSWDRHPLPFVHNNKLHAMESAAKKMRQPYPRPQSSHYLSQGSEKKFYGTFVDEGLQLFNRLTPREEAITEAKEFAKNHPRHKFTVYELTVTEEIPIEGE